VICIYLQIPAGSRSHQGGSTAEESDASWPLTDRKTNPRFWSCWCNLWYRCTGWHSWQCWFTERFSATPIVTVVDLSFEVSWFLYSFVYIGAHSTDLVKALDSVSEWANMWQLKIATSKCIAHRIPARSQLSSNDCP